MDAYWPMVGSMVVLVVIAFLLVGYLILATNLTLSRRWWVRFIGWDMYAALVLALIFGIPAFVLSVSGGAP